MITIIKVAVKHKGKVHSLPAPNRHKHVIHMLSLKPHEVEYGFIDSLGNFIDQKLAMILALGNGQIISKDTDQYYVGMALHSEQLW
jgi:hypothetical protein